ncbi:hypothetical protein [Streptomyces fragilis]
MSSTVGTGSPAGTMPVSSAAVSVAGTGSPAGCLLYTSRCV